MKKSGPFTAEFCNRESLEEMYDLCAEEPTINPEYVFAKAAAECGLKYNSEHNYWGYATPNGSGLAGYDSWQTVLKKFKKTMVEDYQDPTSWQYAEIMKTYQERKSCTSPRKIDVLGYGEPDTLPGVLSLYTFLGEDHNAASAGSGGLYYLDPWDIIPSNQYEGENKIIFETKAEFEQLCGRPHGTSGGTLSSVKTTVWEQGMYTAWGAKGIIKMAKSIWGERAGTHIP